MLDAKHFRYEVVQESVHYVTFFKADVASLTQAIYKYDEVIGNHDAGAPLLLVSDSSQSGSLPIQHVVANIRELHRKHGDEKFRNIRLAFVVKNPYLIGSLMTLVSVLRSGMAMRAFAADQRDEAISWLKRFEEKLISE